MPYVISIMSQ